MADDPDGSLEERLRELFGDTIYKYTDDDAITDGVLIPFVTARGDTGHRITRNAYTTLESHYRTGYPTYSDADFVRFFLLELQPLIPAARQHYDNGEILKTTYDFKVVDRMEGILWYLPNENRGITIMLPEDY